MATTKTTDLDKLQGTWHVTSAETDGNAMPGDEFVDATITVEGTQFSSRGMGFDYSGTIELSPDKKPKAFDLVFTAGPPAGMRNRGIYTLDGDTWTICLATRADARPRRFATKADSGLALETLKRGKPVRRPKPAGRPEPLRRAEPLRHPERSEGSDVSPKQQILRFTQDDDKPATEIEGEFPMVSAVIDGKPLASDMVKWCKRVTHGNITQVLAGPQSMLDAEFTLDPTKTPHHIDYVNRSGKQKGKSQAGIYEITDGLLKICVAPPGNARPTDFSSKKGDGRSYTVWRL
jgi:uncharacterized protein (TIGR03067 family)